MVKRSWKLSLTQKYELREMLEQGLLTQEEMADELGVTQSAISDMMRRRGWVRNKRKWAA